MPEDSFDSGDPSKFTGLQLPAYILKCLAKGEPQDVIAARFPEDGELVGLWVMFLRNNHWVEKPDGFYRITTKGHEWITKYDGGKKK